MNLTGREAYSPLSPTDNVGPEVGPDGGATWEVEGIDGRVCMEEQRWLWGAVDSVKRYKRRNEDVNSLYYSKKAAAIERCKLEWLCQNEGCRFLRSLRHLAITREGESDSSTALLQKSAREINEKYECVTCVKVCTTPQHQRPQYNNNT